MSMRSEQEILDAISEEIHLFHGERKRGDARHAEHSVHGVQALSMNWTLGNDWQDSNIWKAIGERWQFRGEGCCGECDQYAEDLEDGLEPEDEEHPASSPTGVALDVWSAEIYGCDPELHDDGDWCDDCYDIAEWITGYDSEESARIAAIGSMQRLIEAKTINPAKAWALLVVHASEGEFGRMTASVNWRDLETVKGEDNGNA